MAKKSTVLGVYKNTDEAGHAIERLRESKAVEDVSFMAYDKGHVKALREQHGKGADAAKGAGVGAGVGGLTGALLGASALVIPGAGPIVAAGWLAAAIGGAVTGAVTGGVVGALKHKGIGEEEAKFMDERLRAGDILIAAEVEKGTEQRVEDIMKRAGGTRITSVEGISDVEHARERAEA